MALIPLDVLYHRAMYVLRHEGARALARQGFSFVLNRFFSYGCYYIFEMELSPADEGIQVIPKIDCVMEIVTDLREFAQLTAKGCDFKAMNFKSKLERGAMAFCLFVEQELASVTWVALNQMAKREIDSLPFEVNFEKGEACSGASFTDPPYRGKGLLAYTYSHIFPYLAGNGVRKDKFSIDVNNMPSQRAMSKFNPVIISKGRYMRVLWWHFWREKPVRRTD